jgi:hypothetical protein
MRVALYLSVACVSVFAAACTERSPLAPPHPRAMSLNANRTLLPQLSHPNSEKYRDAGFHAATSRSGTAVVSTRALLHKAGGTTLDVTTGTFDATGPGSLVSVQVKGFTPSKRAFRSGTVTSARARTACSMSMASPRIAPTGSGPMPAARLTAT